MSLLVLVLASTPGALGSQGIARLSQPPTTRPAPEGAAVASAPLAPGSPRSAPSLQVRDEAPPVLLAPLDDAVPLPDAPLRRTDGAKDALDAPASGDPDFLGFVAGPYYPLHDETLGGQVVDPELRRIARSAGADGRPQPVVYAFAMLGKRITTARLAQLEARGARVLGLHPWNCVKLAIPAGAIDEVAGLSDVLWLGTPRRWQRIHPGLTRELEGAPASSPLAILVDVYDSDLCADSIDVPIAAASQADGGVLTSSPIAALAAHVTRSNGWQQRALEALGVEVGTYMDGVRAFRVKALPADVERILDLDFVQFVEPDFPTQAGHDNSTPMISSDYLRAYYDGGVSRTVVAGQIDSGLDIAHTDLAHTWGVGWELSGTGGPWNDVCQHGTSVAGTFLGDGTTVKGERGTAYGLGWGGAGRFYNVKVSDACSGWNLDLAAAMSVLHTPYFDGVNTSPIPMIVNNSWGGTGAAPYSGTEMDARLVDDEVYGQGQMYVFCAGNSGNGAGSIWLEGAAKDAFTVGSVRDWWVEGSVVPGEIVNSSSRGPTKDGRWKPNVVAPGEDITSCLAGSGNGYATGAGTSFAAPHVAGVAAMLLDAQSFLRYAPERTESLLMATALPRNGVSLGSPGTSHHNSYGAGQIDGWRATFATATTTWSNWGTYLPGNSTTYADFYVNPGCTKLSVCMHYVEPSASSGASKALLSDFDLYIDAPPIDPSFNTGEYFAQQSTVDNTEIRTIDNPASGWWRWKIWPTNAPQGVYYGLTVATCYAEPTPRVVPSVTSSKFYLRPYQDVTVTASCANPGYTASDVVLEPFFSGVTGTFASAYKYLADGVQGSTIPSGGHAPISLGQIPDGQTRSGIWVVRFPSEGIPHFIVNFRGENIFNTTSSTTFFVDGTPPSAPANLLNLTWPTGAWRRTEGAETFQWDASSDYFVGVEGYSYELGHSANPFLDSTIETSGPSAAPVVTSSAQPWYFSVLAVDRSGNSSATSTVGPFYVDAYPPSVPSGLGVQIAARTAPGTGSTASASWTPSTDAHSGVAGYGVRWDSSPATQAPTTVSTATPAATRAFTPAEAGKPFWLHVRAIDVAGNQSATAHYGPFFSGSSAGGPPIVKR